ncbi:MAG: DUF1186 domain-containing protein [Thermoguttaceae bacterium]
MLKDKFPISKFSPAIQKLCNFRPPQSSLTAGSQTHSVTYYIPKFSLSSDDIPALIEIATWLCWDDTALADYLYAPQNAWEALLQFDAVLVAPEILKLLNRIDWYQADVYRDFLGRVLSGFVENSATKAKESENPSLDVVPLFLAALHEKERHEMTRCVIYDAFLNGLRSFPEHKAAFNKILFDELAELRVDCRSFYAECVCALAFEENPTPEMVALINRAVREGYAETYILHGNSGLEENFGFDFEKDEELLELQKKSKETFDVLRAFQNCGNTFPMDAVIKARELRDWIVPNLIEEVRNATAYSKFGVDFDNATLLFAIHLLGEFQAKEALPAIFDSLALTEEQLWDGIYGEALFESLPGIMYRLIGDDLHIYDEKLRDSNASAMLRYILLQTLPYLVKSGALPADNYFDLLGEYLRTAIDEENEKLVTGVICDLPYSGNVKYWPIAKEAFDKELVEEEIVSRESVEDDLHGNPKFGPLGIDHLLPRRECDDAAAVLQTWAWFNQDDDDVENEDKEDDDSTKSEDFVSLWNQTSSNLFGDTYDDTAQDVSKSGTIRNSSAKVGRNDPCPCGSGKKYKKCCLKK